MEPEAWLVIGIVAGVPFLVAYFWARAGGRVDWIENANNDDDGLDVSAWWREFKARRRARRRGD